MGSLSYHLHIANRAYQEMADHYRTAILPARVLAPKDKAAVEGSVGQITTHILAKLRNHKFFSLAELNGAIREELEAFNHAPFQKKDGTRASVFREEEAPFLQPLPRIPYRYAAWKQATVQLNYHVTLEYQNYSVPYAYARKRVDVRIADHLVEVYCNGQRIASHKRLTGRRGQYATVPDHMPPNHRLYSEWNGARFRSWARKIGPATFETVDKQLKSYAIEEQAYKGGLALLKLSDQYGKEKLERACSSALRQMRLPEFARGYEEQLDAPETYSAMTFDERLAMLVDREADAKHDKHIKRLVKQASFPNSRAFLADLEYLPDRHLDRDLIRNLSTNEYIRRKRNLIIMGATGSGKTSMRQRHTENL